MRLLRLYSDEFGESHFEVVDYPMTLLDDSPPAKPHYFTEARPATGWASVRCPPDWDGGIHPAPRRQIIVCTGGAIRVTTSLGDTREISPGGVVLLEDTQGKGYISEVTSTEPFEAMIIRLE